MCMSSTNSLDLSESNSFVDNETAKVDLDYGSKSDMITEKQSKEMLDNTLSI
nr:hypothetical protein [uncultured Mediterranean phage uvMED]